MAQNHNIFSDTALGGVLSFLAQPAATSPVNLLGIPAGAPAAVGRVDETALKVFLGQSGTANWFAMFDGGNSLVNAPVELQGSFPAWVVHFEGSVKVRDNLIFDAMTAPGVTPANLRVMVSDGDTVRFLSPPVPTAEQEYYLRMTTGGLGWAGQAPGGGGATGVEGSGVPDRAAVWSASTSIRTSILKVTTSAVDALGSFAVRPAGGESSPEVFKVAASSITAAASVLPDYATFISPAARVLIWAETTALQRASPAMLRGWLDVPTNGDVSGWLSSYLPLAAGPSYPLTGRLYQTTTTQSPAFTQLDSSGVATGIANSAGTFVVFQADRSWNYIRNAIEYYTASGQLRVWENVDGSWQSLVVATQQWAGNTFAQATHRHSYSGIDMDSGYLMGRYGAGVGQAQEIAVGDGLSLTSGGRLNSTALVASVALAGPAADVTVTGSPVTSVGQLEWQWQVKGANTFLAGPQSGSTASTPGFRGLVLADISATALGTGTANSTTILYGDRTWKPAPSGGGNVGTVTEVGLSAPSQFLPVANSPITGAGTLGLAWANQAINTVLVGPASGASTVPTFRLLGAADIRTDALGSGSASAQTVLYGNRTWGALPAGIGEAPAGGPHGRTAGSWVDMGDWIGGGGTDGTLTKWSGPASIGNSGFTESGLRDELDGKSDIGHMHSISDVSTLEAQLNSKATISGSNNNYFAIWNASSQLTVAGLRVSGSFVESTSAFAANGGLWINGVQMPTPPTTASLYAIRGGTTPTWEAFTPGGGGVTDHGALTGLADDDHTQYYNQARGDARYMLKPSGLAAGKPYVLVDGNWVELTGTGQIVVEVA